jgi:hypothetical protein
MPKTRACVCFPPSITIINIDIINLKRERLIWLTVLEVPVHDWLASFASEPLVK